MMNSVLEYKGYHTRVEYSVDDKTLRGVLEGINDYVDFECDNALDVETEFHKAVDDYLEFCKEVGKKPEKEYRGLFNVRIKPDLHKQLAIKALRTNHSINSCVEEAIEAYVAL
jgi:predicted HicB family RNase H-like nuclease